MTLRLLVLALGYGGLVDHGAHPGVVGVVVQRRQLLVEHAELLPGALEALVHVAQTALDG